MRASGSKEPRSCVVLFVPLSKESDGVRYNRAFFRDVWSLMRGFWQPRTRWTMFLLAAAILGLQAYYVSVMVDYNA